MSIGNVHDSGGGWKRNPLVGAAAGIAALILFVSIVSRICCRGRGEEEHVVGNTVTMVCPHCKAVYEVEREQVGAGGEDSADGFQAKACEVACPKCGRKGSAVAAFCSQCGKPFAPPATMKQLEGFTCPHCGKNPWGS